VLTMNTKKAAAILKGHHHVMATMRRMTRRVSMLPLPVGAEDAADDLLPLDAQIGPRPGAAGRPATSATWLRGGAKRR